MCEEFPSAWAFLVKALNAKAITQAADLPPRWRE